MRRKNQIKPWEREKERALVPRSLLSSLSSSSAAAAALYRFLPFATLLVWYWYGTGTVLVPWYGTGTTVPGTRYQYRWLQSLPQALGTGVECILHLIFKQGKGAGASPVPCYHGKASGVRL